MPLVRARCRACTLPLGDPPHVAIAVRCGRCGVQASVAVAADGQPADFDPSFDPVRLLAWFAYARLAMAAGTPGVALGACAACRSPLVLSSREAMSLPCPHCGEAVTGASGEILLDQWTEPWTRVEGGSAMRLEYRLVWLDAKSGLSAGCSACGAPTPPGDGDATDRCPNCGSVTWVARGDTRMQLGVRVDGTRDGRPFKGLVPIAQAEAMLRMDASRGSSARAGTSFLGATGIGCAAVIAACVVVTFAIWIAVHFSKC
jgi:predicted RNA-binding Zn-ribbon protein involved in translation (DUF1610 family)